MIVIIGFFFLTFVIAIGYEVFAHLRRKKKGQDKHES